jgi:hypothetical protein
MGARADLAVVAAECLAKVSDPDYFTLLAELRLDEGQSTIIGETRYAYDAVARHGDFAISVADVFQRKGVGLQMMTSDGAPRERSRSRDDRGRNRAR